jgi:DNA-directed RNA polymerase sigma subunit (sigma70/sigma32)
MKRKELSPANPASPEDPGERGLTVYLEAQVRRYPRLAVADRARLLAAVQQGDSQASQQLVEHHLYLVLEVAAEYRNQGLGIGDLFQAGAEGLLVGVEHFRGVEAEFVASSRQAVARAIEGALANESEAVKNESAFVDACRALERAEVLLKTRLGRPPTDQELAAALEWDDGRVETIRRILVDARTRQDLEMLAYLDDGEEPPSAEKTERPA